MRIHADKSSPANEHQLLLRQELMVAVYDQLRLLAAELLRAERRGHTLQPTAVVHEAYARLCVARQVEWRNPAHFFAFAAAIIRRVLVDHARSRDALKRGGGRVRVSLSESALASTNTDVDILDLNAGLTELSQLSAVQAQVVELRFFGGLTTEEAASEMGIAVRTADKYWAAARAWLAARLDSNANDA